MSGDGLPLLLTVEEAGALLRIGRTKAYAMAREWRETDGRSGLPVIDLGHVLRVPRRALEELIGADLADVSLARRGGESEDQRASAQQPVPPSDPRPQTSPGQPAATNGRRRRRKSITNQLDLFDGEPASEI